MSAFQLHVLCIISACHVCVNLSCIRSWSFRTNAALWWYNPSLLLSTELKCTWTFNLHEIFKFAHLKLCYVVCLPANVRLPQARPEYWVHEHYPEAIPEYVNIFRVHLIVHEYSQNSTPFLHKHAITKWISFATLADIYSMAQVICNHDKGR